MFRLFATLLSLFLLTLSAFPADSGVIVGNVRIQGRLKKVKGGQNPYATAYDALDAKANPSAHLIVFLEDDLGRFPPRQSRRDLPQAKDQLAMDMIPILPGEEVDLTNRSQLCHSLFSFSELKEFRLGRCGFGEGARLKFPKAAVSGVGVVNIFCELHPEERAYVLVMPNPYWVLVDRQQAFSREGAPFRIEGLRPRVYTLTTWHPNLQAVPVKVTVKANQETRADLVMKGD